MRRVFLALTIPALAVFAACSNAALSNPVEPAGDRTANVNKSSSQPAAAQEEAPRITLADAKKEFDAGAAVFIDTRAEAAFQAEHIQGAINIPAAEFETRYKEVPKNKKIIAYCSWPAEHTSARAVQILMENGYKNAFALLGGTAAWKNAGYPMETAK